MNQKEKELFLELCTFLDPNKKKIERLIKNGYATSEVLGMLFSNRVAAIAYGVLKESELLDRVDREFRTSLSNAAMINDKKNEDFIGCIKFLTEELEKCKVPYALLKGAYLCYQYPKGYRTSNDIDVLISPDDVGKVSAQLKVAGFRQGEVKNNVFVPATRAEIIESKMTRGETVPFIKATKLPFINFLEVDLNFSLDYKNSNDEILKKMLDRTQIVNVESNKIRTLDKYDFVLHCCAHLYKEATTMPWIRMKRDMTFYKYCDIYTLIYTFTEDDYKELFLRAEENGLKKELIYCLRSMVVFFPKKYKSLEDLYEDTEGLDQVISPKDKVFYCYTETDIVKRFFSADRVKMLKEEGL